jgi:hypothetical protein
MNKCSTLLFIENTTKMTNKTENEKLDIFVEMRNADLRNKDFYTNLSTELQKQFSGYPAMRWMSSVSDSSPMKDWYLIMVNEIVNKNFWEISKHPELVWKLLAISGSGETQKHSWIPMPAKKKIGKVAEYMLRWYPSYNDQELNIVISNFNRDTFEEFVKSTGADDNELAAILKEYDTENGTKPAKKPRKSKSDSI